MFKDLQPGYPVYVFVKGEKGEKLEYNEGTFERLETPKFDTDPKEVAKLTAKQQEDLYRNMIAVKNGAANLVIKVDGEERIIYGVNTSASIVSSPAIAVSCTKDAILTDINVTLTNSKRHIEDVSKHENIIKECENILNQIDPSKLEIMERDNKINELTELVKKQSEQFNMLQEMLLKNQKATESGEQVKTTKNK